MGRQLDRAPAYIGNLPVRYVLGIASQWRIENLVSDQTRYKANKMPTDLFHIHIIAIYYEGQ
jgi:hypothetical protein